MDNISKALAFAIKAHEGQLDRGGAPYIYHPINVAMHVNSKEAKVLRCFMM